MTVGELKEYLENYDDEQVILIGTQPAYPLAFHLEGTASYADREVECPDHEGYLLDHDPECEAAYEADEEDGPDSELSDYKVVWLIVSEGSPTDRSPYAPRWLWDEDGWDR